MSLKNSGPERSFSSHDMSQTLWEIPRAQLTTDYWTAVPFSLWRGYTPPRILTKRVLSLCFPPSLCYFPLLYLSWGDVASTSFLKELGPLRQRWRRLVFYRQEPAHTQTHNAHSFRFKHVNCFPSVLGTHPSLGNLLIVCEEFQLGLKGFLNWSRGSNT